MFDNETREYVDLGDLCENAAWVIDDNGLLYIIPFDPTLESVAPDNETTDALDNDIREYGMVRGETVDAFGLLRVPEPLRRFNPVDGYYTA